MTNVLNLGGKPAAVAAQPNAEVVAMLEQLLVDAKAGRVQHVMAAYSDGKSPPTDLYAGSGEVEHVMTLIGALELCKHTALMHLYQASADFTTAG